ncbi:MAG: transglutaminase-like domain-containing protein [Chloroflexota bacterium]
MAKRLFDFLYFRFQPAEGWLPFVLLLGAVSSGIITIVEVGWVPEDRVVFSAGYLGLLMSVGLAKRPLSTISAWIFLILYGFVVVTLHLVKFWPPLEFFFINQGGIFPYWQQNSALFIDRFGSWLRALSTNGRSQETIVFAFALGLITWFLTAYAGWSTFRNRKPLLGLTAMGLGVSINLFFGDVPPFWSAIFVGQVGILTAVLQYSNLETEWKEKEIDFSDEVRTELVLYALGISAVLISVSYLVPGIPFTRIAEAFANQPIVQAAEDSFEEIFAGVNQPRQEPSPGGVGGVGVLPRSYLIGNSPELYEIVMMQAEVSIVDEDSTLTPAPYAAYRGNHWRGLSYEEYTGRGWALTDERTEPIDPQETIALREIDGEQLLFQQIDWQRDNRLTRYTLGLPVSFEDESIAYWRGLDDLVRIRGDAQEYSVTSRISVASPDALRETAVANANPVTIARYTQLPESIPQRVHDLAQEIAAGLDNPYDQARAIELFLRQYPYSLDVSLPPENQDPVDYFLFDLQTGYCDYYASSMVVLARSLGLPARMGIGYLPQPPDENGVQTIFQINGHSWAEVYFEGYGWIEFEPTPAFPSPQDESRDSGFEASAAPEQPEPASPPIPEADPITPFPWGRIGLIASTVAGLLIWQLWERRRRLANEIVWTYGRLQKSALRLGFEDAGGATPYEFADRYTQFLNRFSQRNWLHQLASRLGPPIQKIVSQFVQYQYAEQSEEQPGTVRQAWRGIRRPLWVLRLIATIRQIL